MPALDLIRPSVTAMRVIASVNADFARELKLPPHIRSLGLISADSDDVTYIAADEATKQAMVEVVYGRSLYAGAAHGPSPTAGDGAIPLRCPRYQLPSEPMSRDPRKPPASKSTAKPSSSPPSQYAIAPARKSSSAPMTTSQSTEPPAATLSGPVTSALAARPAK